MPQLPKHKQLHSTAQGRCLKAEAEVDRLTRTRCSRSAAGQYAAVGLGRGVSQEGLARDKFSKYKPRTNTGKAARWPKASQISGPSSVAAVQSAVLDLPKHDTRQAAAQERPQQQSKKRCASFEDDVATQNAKRAKPCPRAAPPASEPAARTMQRSYKEALMNVPCLAVVADEPQPGLTCHSSLTALPKHLLETITANLDELKDVAALAVTCRATSKVFSNPGFVAEWLMSQQQHAQYPLHAAIRLCVGSTTDKLKASGFFEQVVKCLVERYGADVNALDSTVWFRRRAIMSPLIEAASHDVEGIAKQLLEYGADANKRCGSLTPLFFSCSVGMVRLLVAAGADVNGLHGGLDERRLHRAVMDETFDIMEALIDAGADVNAPNKNGLNALHYAALRGSEEAVRLLVLRYGMNVNCTDDRGCTPLHASALGRFFPDDCGNGLRTASLLLELGAQLDATNAQGQTPLAVAVEAKYSEMAELLRSALEARAEASQHLGAAEE